MHSYLGIVSIAYFIGGGGVYTISTIAYLDIKHSTKNSQPNDSLIFGLQLGLQQEVSIVIVHIASLPGFAFKSEYFFCKE